MNVVRNWIRAWLGVPSWSENASWIPPAEAEYYKAEVRRLAGLAAQAQRVAVETDEKLDALAAELGVRIVAQGGGGFAVASIPDGPSLLKGAQEFVAAVESIDKALAYSRGAVGDAAHALLKTGLTLRRLPRAQGLD